MVLVRLYGNSWKWQQLRRCFAEWIIRMDQFGEMSKTKQVVHAETSERGTAGKRTKNAQLNQCMTLLGNSNCEVRKDIMKTAHILLSNGDMEYLSCSKRWYIQAKTNFPTESCIPRLSSLGKVNKVRISVALLSPRIPLFVARGHNCNVTYTHRDVIFT